MSSSPLPRPAKPPKVSWSSFLSQMFPPNPAFQAPSVPDLTGKVFIVTGANAGVGRELTQILYSKNARVYLGCRSEQRAQEAIATIKANVPSSRGAMTFLLMDFADLATLKPAVTQFLQRESTLHALFNNAAVQALSDTAGSQQTKQGYELHFGVNILAPFLLTRLLTPVLQRTAAQPATDVRVVWVCSLGTEVVGEADRGISTDYLRYFRSLSPLERYGVSKAGSWLHAVEYARRYTATDNILSVPCNPGHLRSDLYREGGTVFRAILNTFVLYPPIYGAYTLLWSAFAPEVNKSRSGDWVAPWGRFHDIRPDLLRATRSEKDGGNGHAAQFWEWCEERVKTFL